MKHPAPPPAVSRETPPLSVSRETGERLRLFCDLLLRWNARINLVSANDAGALWHRHIEDSLQLVPLIPAGTHSALDLGSGAGFPGLILAIATGIPFGLAESDQRKAAFLREVARETEAPATVHATRIETLSLPPVQLVTARALAPLPKLLDLSARFLAPAGAALFLKGAQADQELTAARATWNMCVERFPSVTDPAGHILKLTEISPAGGGGGTT